MMKFTNQIVLLCLLSTLIVYPLFTQENSEGPRNHINILDTPPDRDPELCFNLDNECRSDVDIIIKTANIFSGNPMAGEVYQLPTDVLPIYLAYQLSDGSISRMALSNEYLFKENYNGIAVYYQKVNLPNLLLGGNCTTANSQVELSLSLSLQAWDDEEEKFIPYPLCLYNSPSGVFSSAVFEEALCDCINGFCPTGFTASLNICCASCDGIRTDAPTNKFGFVENLLSLGSENEALNPLGKSILPTIETIEFTPNPFHSDLNLTITSVQEGVAVIQIFSARGGLVLQRQQQLKQGEQAFQLQLPQLAEGLYFAKVLTPYKEQTFKVVKA